MLPYTTLPSTSAVCSNCNQSPRTHWDYNGCPHAPSAGPKPYSSHHLISRATKQQTATPKPILPMAAGKISKLLLQWSVFTASTANQRHGLAPLALGAGGDHQDTPAAFTDLQESSGSDVSCHTATTANFLAMTCGTATLHTAENQRSCCW